MPSRKLTETFARSVGAEVRAYHWDSQVAGFGLRVGPSRRGSRKVWVYRYRPVGSKAVREHKLGTYPAVDFAGAREQALELTLAVAKGADPSRGRRARAVAMTVSELCDRYETRMATMSPKTAHGYRSMIKTHVLNKKYGIGKLAVVDVAKDDAQKLINVLSEQVGRKGIRQVGQAKKVCGFLGTLFNYAIEEGLRPEGSSPLRGVRVDARRREWELDKIEAIGHVFEPSETPRVWQAFAEARIHATAADALRLIALTGLRYDEIRTLPWRDVVLEGDYPHLAVRRHKTDVRHPIKEVPLAPEAVKLLRAQGPGLPGAFVFPSPVDASIPVGDLWSPWNRVRKLAGVPRARVHDLRGLAACHLAANGWSEAQIQIFMGWDSREMVRKYVGGSQEMKREGAEILEFGVTGRTGKAR